ncbi:hypothetical protein Barb4_02152 [Bacteroidales bacterium Barb4]|nr:hypothetical protein Barb4_02152 [Bacteroidales bacterium Barb4]
MIQIQIIFTMQPVTIYIYLSFFQNSLVAIIPLTPHAAQRNVGLKSLALSGLLCHIGTVVLQELGT